MYLERLKIKNFRVIKETEIHFQKGINILIGENNAGKTTIIDVLRICIGYGEQNSLKVTRKDLYKLNGKFLDIEFDLIFNTSSKKDKSLFYELYDAKEDILTLHFRYTYNKSTQRIYPKIWGGSNEETKIPNYLFYSMINHHLSALRDANRYLKPGKLNKLSNLFSDIELKCENYEKESMMQDINSQIQSSNISEFINYVTDEYINNKLKEISLRDKELILSIHPVSQEFTEFTKNLEVTIENKYSKNLSLTQNGLGYNNLIYISILLSYLDNLKNNDEIIYVSLSIEEPEAHLHPQLQNLFFSYLNKLNDKFNEDTPFQIFITSHSPTLVSKADLDSLILIQTENGNLKTLSLSEVPFEKDTKNYLKKFLDVTKSQLFFSNRIIFVEGISEELLIPILAMKKNINLEKLGVEIINVHGLSFKRFKELFNENSFFKGIILTDDDRSELNGSPSNTCENIKKLKNENLKVYSSFKTFEFDLLNSNNEYSIVWELSKILNRNHFVESHKLSEKELFEIFNNPKIRLNKSQFAWELYNALNNSNQDIILPDYINEAFDFINEEF